MRFVHRSSVVAFLTLVPLAAIVAACGEPIPSASRSTASTPAAPRTRGPSAQAMFDSLCFTCHGSTGHGDGPGAAALQPKPRSFADPAWQDSVTDDGIKKTIVFGGAAVGKSAIMPAQPQLKGNEAVLDGLVKIVRAFKAQPQGDAKTDAKGDAKTNAKQ